MNFKPSQVCPFARSFAPFVGTFGRVELEVAAAILVAVLTARGDEWRALRTRDVGEWLQALIAGDASGTGLSRQGLAAWRWLLDNPFMRPDFRGLAAEGAGWAEITHADDGTELLQFTTAALDRMWEKGWMDP